MDQMKIKIDKIKIACGKFTIHIQRIKRMLLNYKQAREELISKDKISKLQAEIKRL